MNEKLVSIANDTLKIVKDGGYEYNRKLIKLDEPKNGLLYPENYFEKKRFSPSMSSKHTTVFVVENKPVVDRILEEQKYDLCVLNFASAKHPGGGFLRGTMAQEESMAYCSDLYYTLYQTRLYDLNVESKSKYYTDNMVLSDVTFFKNSKYQLINQPKTVKVISSPAVNMNLIPNDTNNIEKAKQIMKSRMRKIIQLAIDANCKNLVLGAFGCGVFKNNHEDISKAWYELLIIENYKIYFDIIYFTVYDKDINNIKHYQRYFSNF